MDNPNDSEDNCEADVKSDMELDNGMEASESPELQDVSSTPNVLGVIRPTRKLKNKAEDSLVTVNAITTRRNKGNKAN